MHTMCKLVLCIKYGKHTTVYTQNLLVHTIKHIAMLLNTHRYTKILMYFLSVLSGLPLNGQQAYSVMSPIVIGPFGGSGKKIQVESNEFTFLGKQNRVPSPLRKDRLYRFRYDQQRFDGYELLSNNGSLSGLESLCKQGSFHGINLTISTPPSTPNSGLVVFQPDDSIYWGRLTGNVVTTIHHRATFLSSGEIVTSHQLDSTFSDQAVKRCGFMAFDQYTGDTKWSYYYTLPDTNRYQVRSIAERPGDGFSVLLDHGLPANPANYEALTLLAHIRTSDGEVMNSIGIRGSNYWFYSHDVDAEGNTYLAGSVLRRGGFNVLSRWGITNGFIAKFDANYQLIWCRELIAEAAAFPCFFVEVKVTGSNELTFSYSTYDQFPTIFGKMTADSGELLYTRGYSLYRAWVDLVDDGSMGILSFWSITPDSTFTEEIKIVKTTPEGIVPSCPQLDACLIVQGMPLVLEPIPLLRSPGPNPPRFDVSAAISSFEYTPFCDTAALPTADFVLPDTLCLGECAAASGLRNQLAQKARWHISAPGIIDTLIDGKSLLYCFDLPGRYLVTHTIWILGCAYEYEQLIVILDDRLQALGADQIVCSSPPLVLSPQWDRQIYNLRWDNGSTAPLRIINISGAYTIEASDGYCSLHDTVNITFLADTLHLPPFSGGISDTTICYQHFPVSLLPQSPYAQEFFFDGRAVPQTEWIAATPGNYQVEVEVFGCRLAEEIILNGDPCLAGVYLPNVFSPNDDGVNDFLQPLGVDFIPLQLDVFDRWGGWLYSTTEAPFRWDGAAAEGQAGVYLIILRLLNTRTGEEERISQEVLLIR